MQGPALFFTVILGVSLALTYMLAGPDFFAAVFQPISIAVRSTLADLMAFLN